MRHSLRVLHVEDSERDQMLVDRHLARAGYDLVTERVETAEAMRAALWAQAWDVILCDYSMPQFNALGALAVLHEMGLDIPFIIISGTVGEEVAVGAMRAGAQDYLMKDNLVRLAPTIERELREAGHRRARHQAEKELRDSEERYRDLVENARDIIYTHDLEGNYTSMNKAGELITGLTREEALKMNLIQTVAPEYIEKARQMMASKLAGGAPTIYDLEIIAKDGRRVAVEVNTRLIYQDGEPVGVQGIARDVTERRQLEEQLRQAQKMEAVGRLAGGIAHDFNNLLTVINGYSELALMQLDPDAPLYHNLEEIHKAGERAAALTRQLLVFSRKQVLQPRLLDLNKVVSEMGKILRRVIGEDIELRTMLASGLGYIKADPGQVEQVIMNLAVNARDAMPQGGKLTIETANVELDDTYARYHLGITPGAHVMLAVSDTGTGMDAETQKRIFEPFFTTKESGTGLGLSTVYGIARQGGGGVWVYSEPGGGATFKVYWPRSGEDEPAYQADAEVEEALRGSETVLLVEDEEMVRRLAREVLEMHGYRVLEAANGGAALLICERHQGPIPLLLTDVVMPEMSGRELASRLELLHPEMRVIYMSGYTDDAIVHHRILDSELSFLQKPFTPLALARKVREVLDK